jgi:hypothetical protein
MLTLTMVWAAVPEATVNEDSDTLAGESNINPASGRGERRQVDAIAEAAAV